MRPSVHSRRSVRRALLRAGVLTSVLLGACSGDDDPLFSSDRPGDPLDGGVDPTGSQMDASVRGRGSLDARAPEADAGTREICDGLDNDGNGEIDDLDLQHDGVCDCLRVATLGQPGRSGRGNVFGAWLDRRSDAGAVALGSQTITPELLAPFQVIIAQDLSAIGRTYTAAEVAALEAWVRAGGGLMTLTGFGDPGELTNVNAILARFGARYEPTPVLQKRGVTSIPITGWLGPHPIVEGVSRVGVDNGYPVAGAGTTLAREAGIDLLKAQAVERGHLIVFGDEWITYDSEWSEHPDYQVETLWLNMIKWLTVERVCQVSTTSVI